MSLTDISVNLCWTSGGSQPHLGHFQALCQGTSPGDGEKRVAGSSVGWENLLGWSTFSFGFGMKRQRVCSQTDEIIQPWLQNFSKNLNPATTFCPQTLVTNLLYNLKTKLPRECSRHFDKLRDRAAQKQMVFAKKHIRELGKYSWYFI